MNKVYELDYLKKLLHENLNNYSSDEPHAICERILKLLDTLALKEVNEGLLIDTYKYLSEEAYLKKDYLTCYDYIQKMLKLNIYQIESNNNKTHIMVRNYQCCIYLAIYDQRSEDLKHILIEAEKYRQMSEYQMVESLKTDLNIVIDLGHSYLKNHVYTAIKFSLPYMVHIIPNYPIEFVYKNITVNISFEHFHNNGKADIVETNSDHLVELEIDKYGILNYSEVLIKFKKFWDITHDLTGFLKLCTEVYNYFLSYYKHETQEFWLDDIAQCKIFGTAASVYTECNQIIEVPFYSEQIYKILPLESAFNKDNILHIENALAQFREYSLWSSMILKAKNSMLLGDDREAILQINTAFENFLYLRAHEILEQSIGNEKTECFFEGIVDYEDFNLKEYMTEEQFNHAVSSKIIKKQVPSIYSVIKKCIQSTRMMISIREAQKLTSIIKKNRNDLIHGNCVKSTNLKADAENSLKAFEEFIRKFNISENP